MSELALPDQGTLAAAAGLLAHWWSRPVAAEVECWVGAAETEASVRRRLTVGADGAGSSDAGLAYSADQVPALLADYEQLFVGPGQVRCPPYESFWRDDVPIELWHSLLGPCTADLRRLYRDLGIDVDPAAGELPDHAAVEFEALGYALSRADGEPVAAALVRDHLSRWLPQLCHAVAKEARHPFYRGLAMITPGWLAHVQRHLAGAAGNPPGTP